MLNRVNGPCLRFGWTVNIESCSSRCNVQFQNGKGSLIKTCHSHNFEVFEVQQNCGNEMKLIRYRNLGVLVERQHNSYASQNDRCWSVHQPAMESFGCSCFAPRFGCTRQGLLVFFLLIWSISLLRYVSTWSTFRLRQPMPPKGSELENEVQRSKIPMILCLLTFGI